MHAGLLQRNHLSMLPFTIPLPKLTLPPFQRDNFVSLRARVQIWMEDGGCRAGPASEQEFPKVALQTATFAEILPPTGFLVKGGMTISPKDLKPWHMQQLREVVKQRELSTKRTSFVKYHIDLWRMTFTLFIKETFGDTTWSWVETPLFLVVLFFLYSFANNKNQPILQLLLLSNAVFPDVSGHELHQMLVKCY